MRGCSFPNRPRSSFHPASRPGPTTATQRGRPLPRLDRPRIFLWRIRAAFRRVRLVRLAENLSDQATLASAPQGAHDDRKHDNYEEDDYRDRGGGRNGALQKKTRLGSYDLLVRRAKGGQEPSGDIPARSPSRGQLGSCIESEHDLVRFLVAPMSEPAPLAHDKETALRQHTNRRGVVARSVSVKRTGCLQLQELL